jgi:hypothetical protein
MRRVAENLVSPVDLKQSTYLETNKHMQLPKVNDIVDIKQK